MGKVSSSSNKKLLNLKADWRRKIKFVRHKRRIQSRNHKDSTILLRRYSEINEWIHQITESNSVVLKIITLKDCWDDQRRSHEKIWFFRFPK
jgi:hypothetical protein